MFTFGDAIIITIVSVLLMLMLGYYFVFKTKIDTTEKQVTDTSTHIDERMQSLADYSSSNFAPIESLAGLQQSIQSVSKFLTDKTNALDTKISTTTAEMTSDLLYHIGSVNQNANNIGVTNMSSVNGAISFMSNVENDLYSKYSQVKQDLTTNTNTTNFKVANDIQKRDTAYSDFLSSYQSQNAFYTDQVARVGDQQATMRSNVNQMGSNISWLKDSLNLYNQSFTQNDVNMSGRIDAYSIQLNKIKDSYATFCNYSTNNFKDIDTKINLIKGDNAVHLLATYSNLNDNIVRNGNNTTNTLNLTSSNLNKMVTTNYSILKSNIDTNYTNLISSIDDVYHTTSNIVLAQNKNQQKYTDTQILVAKTDLINYTTNMSNVHSISVGSATIDNLQLTGNKPSCRIVDPGWKVMGDTTDKWNSYLSMCMDNEYMNGVNVMWDNHAGGSNVQGARVMARCCKVPGLPDSTSTYYGTKYTDPGRYPGLVP